MIPRRQLLETARSLASPHGENPEYDRALVELCSDLLGLERSLVELILQTEEYPVSGCDLCVVGDGSRTKVLLNADGVCPNCGVYHGDPCPDCKRRGYHTTECIYRSRE